MTIRLRHYIATYRPNFLAIIGAASKLAFKSCKVLVPRFGISAISTDVIGAVGQTMSPTVVFCLIRRKTNSVVTLRFFNSSNVLLHFRNTLLQRSNCIQCIVQFVEGKALVALSVLVVAARFEMLALSSVAASERFARWSSRRVK